MNWLPPVLYLVLLLDSVLGSLPAPVIVNVSSFNFHHVLHWVPGPGTPSGTCYEIIRRMNRKTKKLKPPLCSNETSRKLKFPDNRVEYTLTVQASYNQTLSPESRKYSFKPDIHTKIGPPKVSLAGCGNCIQINISLPEADPSSRIDDIKTFYGGSQFRVFWRIPNEAQESIVTGNKIYTVNNLRPGTEYCVQVWTEINVNRNTEPSAWNCTFTSIVAPSRDPYVLGAVGTLLPIVIGVLMTSMFCLYYTGFLCKLKETPRVLREALIRGSTLTPDRTIPDNISISAEMEKQRKHNNPTPATRGTNSDEEEEEDEEDEGENVYMDRGAELSSAESSSQNSAGVSGNSKVAASGGSGSLTAVAEVPDTESEVEVRHGGLDHDEAKAKGEEVSFTPDGPVTGEVVVVGDEEVEEEVYESSGNINLFSVTLAALAVGEEGEEDEEQNERDSLTDFLKVSDLQPLLPADSQTESDDWTTVALTLPTQEDFTVNGYEGRRTNTSSDYLKTGDDESQHEETQEKEEEEEEEEFSGYMRHT
ncbi:interferon alpha/beta receptor 1-like isoform X2 [Sebastes umbrosus]|uniref:interferon alpha/beta receptor 1-like isoform X2 n=1 Tax=Sebastes umbrosus TaxID=72105 RepID=UPI00189C8E7E|nr:interferon alpha/beta receptor 1-like isoform X2 [Sebastes umbrosus]